MNASDALLKTLINNGLEVVFANPGTSEMHLVAAIDHHPELRPILGLFESCNWNAYGYAQRMSGLKLPQKLTSSWSWFRKWFCKYS